MFWLQKNAMMAYELLRHAPGLRPIMPQGAMYMMIEIKMSLFPHFKTELQFVERMVTEESVFCLPGQVSRLSRFRFFYNFHCTLLFD